MVQDRDTSRVTSSLPRTDQLSYFQTIVIGSGMGMLVPELDLGLLLNQFRKRSSFN